MNPTEAGSSEPSGLVAFDGWLKSLGRARTTGHRWRKKFPWLRTVNIYGKVYVCRESIEEFERRSIAGEFSREVHPPNGKAAH
jgi:hypothetical protein